MPQKTVNSKKIKNFKKAKNSKKALSKKALSKKLDRENIYSSFDNNDLELKRNKPPHY
jgi:hypothetical protein